LKKFELFYFRGGLKVKDFELEQRVLYWVDVQRQKGTSMSMKRICEEAIAISKEIHGNSTPFKASNGWCWKFCRRNNIDFKMSKGLAKKKNTFA
jgi:hypothetical protein